ncbi:MAG: hypothetical protein ACP5JJ_14520 [Anaerolineae bacterium]
MGGWDEHGNQMAGSHIWEFATRSTTPFLVEGTSPAARRDERKGTPSIAGRQQGF